MIETSMQTSISSWNVWGIPLVSPNYISRTGLTAATAATILGNAIQKNLPETSKIPAGCKATEQTPWLEEPPHLVIMCFQEAWAYRVGIARPLVWLALACERMSRCLRKKQTTDKNQKNVVLEAFRKSSFLTIIASLLAILQGWLFPFSFWPFLWDPKDEMVRILAGKNQTAIPPLKYSIGRHGISMGKWYEPHRLLDSGLLIVLNSPIIDGNFVQFTNQKGEKAANKGFLWAITSGPQPKDLLSTATTVAGRVLHLIVTTHLGSDRTRADQLQQMTDKIGIIERQYLAVGARSVVVYICGDFNIMSNSSEFLELTRMCNALNLEQLTDSCNIGTCTDTHCCTEVCCHNSETREMSVSGVGERKELDYIFRRKASAGEIIKTSGPDAAVWRCCSDHAMVYATHVAEQRTT